MARRWELVGVLLCATALAALITLGAPRDGPAELMEDDGLEASSISMDQNAMLAASPKKNAAFLRVFGSYLGKGAKLKSAPASATQLSQSSSETSGATGSGAGSSSENSKLASQMQAELTAGSQDDQMMTPHFVEALNAASKSTMLASTDDDEGGKKDANLVNKEAMAALSMTDPESRSRQHILPTKLREKYMFSKDSTQLGAANTMTPDQAALQAQPVVSTGSIQQSLATVPSGQGSNNEGGASAADNKLLASAPEGLSTKQLIKQAAMRQMAVLKAKAQMAAAQHPPQAALRPQAPAPAATQQMYQSGYPSPMYQQQAGYYPPQPAAYAQQQQPYVQPATPMLSSGYGSQATTWYPAGATGQEQPSPGQQVTTYNDSPQRLSGYQAPQSRTSAYATYAPRPQAYQQQQFAQPQLAQAAQQSQDALRSSVSQSVMTPAEIGEAAAARAAPDWRSPDAIGKEGKSASMSSKREQMLALKSQIMSDYKKNTEDADKQLLMGV